ncbi:MAG: sortase [Lachnospiraceae bacterium]|nr:sortase [Lachnospiraceae bacterium]
MPHNRNKRAASRRRRRKIGTLLMAIGSLMLLGAVGLLAYNAWDDWRAGTAVVKVQDALDLAMENRNSGVTLYENSTGTRDADDTEMDVIEIDGYDYIGTLSISRYGLELPVMADWSYAGLKIAPACYSGSVWTDDLVICGHNYERHFGYLKDLEEGDTITFTDVDGNVWYYVVNEVLTLEPTAIEEMLAQGGVSWDLTLFTCTTSGQARVTVRLSKVAMVES